MRSTVAASAWAVIAAFSLVACSSSGGSKPPAIQTLPVTSSSSASVSLGPPTLPVTFPSGSEIGSIEASQLATPDTAQNTAFDYHTYLYVHDLAGLQVLTCPGGQLTLTQADIDDINGIESPETTEAGETATSRISINTESGGDATVNLTLSHSGGGGTWCVQTASIAVDTASGGATAPTSGFNS